ncbi:hypothetical protein DMB90_24600 [Raoultella planticola]|uniref:Uncharacterized protein n=1 Tax=Raoultella planticola TaxID=575 RepID=A0A5P6AAQ1_RAOPL|nr:hypothetical protein DMB90_24600 [Raoultella planticola]
MLAAAKLSPSLFSPLVHAGTSIGHITPEVAGLTGLADDVQVAIAGHDHMCGSVAVGLNNENQILNSTGTTEGLLVVTEAVNNSRSFSVPGSLTGSMFCRGFILCMPRCLRLATPLNGSETCLNSICLLFCAWWIR